MDKNSIRLADVPVPKIWVSFWRGWAFPLYMCALWRGMRRNRRETSAAAKQLGETAARVVLQSQRESRILRRLTYAIVALTVVNTGFVIYSALK
jgi:hypothetical protein